MKRRQFIAMVGGAAALGPLGAWAQQAPVPVVGILNANNTPESTVVPNTAFRRGLSEGGYDVGRNVAIEYRYAQGDLGRLAAFADELVRLNVAVVHAGGGPAAAVAAKKATSTIPIVFVTAGDPVGQGLVAALNRPGGNATGFNVFATELDPKRIEMLDQVLPRGLAIAFLVYASEPIAIEQARMAGQASSALGRRLVVERISDDGDFEPVFAAIAARHDGGIAVGATAYFNARRPKIIDLAARYALPAVYEWREFATEGGLMSFGTNLNETYRSAGGYVARILKGEKPADMPVQQPAKFDFVINLKTAKTLGLTFPLPLLGRADEVIE